MAYKIVGLIKRHYKYVSIPSFAMFGQSWITVMHCSSMQRWMISAGDVCPYTDAIEGLKQAMCVLTA